MKLSSAMELIQKYTHCPNCGNDHIGNGEGKLIVEDDSFYRSCKCGWEINEQGCDSG